MTVFVYVVLGLSAAALIALIATDSRRRRAREAADDLEAVRLRLIAAGEDPDADPPAPALDERTAALVVDPTLSAVEVTTIVEHVEHGAGSLASFAMTASDTREMRTAAEVKHLAEVYDEAHDEDVRRDLDRAVALLTEVSRDTWAAIDAWIERYHGETHYANCAHCAEKLHDISGEYAQLVRRVEAEDTGVYTLAELEALQPV